MSMVKAGAMVRATAARSAGSVARGFDARVMMIDETAGASARHPEGGWVDDRRGRQWWSRTIWTPPRTTPTGLPTGTARDPVSRHPEGARQPMSSIVIVDDDEHVCAAIAYVLQRDGHDVHAAHTLAAAIPLVRRLFSKPMPLPLTSRHEPDGWLIRGLEGGAVEERMGPYIIAGGWWRKAVHREYHYVRTARGRWLWVYHDRARRRWFQQGEVG